MHDWLSPQSPIRVVQAFQSPQPMPSDKQNPRIALRAAQGKRPIPPHKPPAAAPNRAYLNSITTFCQRRHQNFRSKAASAYKPRYDGGNPTPLRNSLSHAPWSLRYPSM